MDHISLRHKLSEYIDGAVSSEDRTVIDDHLRTCEKCRAALTELKKTIEHVRSIEEIEPPAWMTQKIMAKVRVEAEQQKSFVEKLYLAFVVKLPVKAVAVVFLAAIAFYMYRDILPMKLSETPMQESAVNKAAPAPDIAKNEPRRAEDSLLRAKRLPQAPEYRALDMKQEYERPAAPALADKMEPAPAPAKPAEQHLLAKKDAAKEKRFLGVESKAPVIAENKTAPAAGAFATAGQESAAAPGVLKSKMAAETKSDKILLTLAVQHRADAAQAAENIIEKLGGEVTRREVVQNANVLFFKLNSTKIGKLVEQLRAEGTLQENDLDATRLPETVMIELRITSPLPPAN
jgi:hypothetical protein